jgi:hypothetical protein
VLGSEDSSAGQVSGSEGGEDLGSLAVGAGHVPTVAARADARLTS